MMERPNIRPVTDARALWLLSVLVLAAAYYFIDAHYQRRIAASREATASLYSRTVANRRIVAQARRLSAMQRKIDGDLRQLYGKRDENSISSLLKLLQRTGTHYGVIVTAVEPQKGNAGPSRGALAASQSTPETFPDRALIGQDIVIRVRGRFRPLLRFVEDLPRHDTIVAVSQTQVQVAGDTPKASANEPSLEAVIRGTLYTFRQSAEDDGATD